MSGLSGFMTITQCDNSGLSFFCNSEFAYILTADPSRICKANSTGYCTLPSSLTAVKVVASLNAGTTFGGGSINIKYR